MKGIERIILIVVAALLLASLTAGLVKLSSPPKTEGTPISHRDLAQAAAADPDGPQLSLWRTDPNRTVKLFGLAVKTGAFNLTSEKPLTLRALVMERGGGFSPGAKGSASIVRKVGGAIGPVATATLADFQNPEWADIPLLAGDVVYAE